MPRSLDPNNPINVFLSEVEEETNRKNRNSLILSPFYNEQKTAEKDLKSSFLINKNFSPLSLDIQTSGNVWVFFTRPYLNLLTDQNDPVSDKNGFVCDLHSYPLKKQEWLVENLNALLPSSGGAFIPILTNLFKKGTSIEDEEAETYKIGETFEDHSMTVSHGISLRNFGNDFSCTFQEIQGMPVMSLFKTITKYIYGAQRGKIKRSQDSRRRNYVDYFMTMYTIVTDVDNESILYWNQHTGITPKSLPFSGLSSENGSLSNFEPTINFSCSVRTSMRVSTLSEFAMLCTENLESLTNGKDSFNPISIAEMYKANLGYFEKSEESLSTKNPLAMDGDFISFSNYPYIERSESGFKLRFLGK